jgi:hypothetical protein
MMGTTIQKFFALAAAVAVLAVSIVCGSATCLMQTRSATASVACPCCARQQPASSAPTKTGQCPICAGAGLVAPTVQKDAGQAAFNQFAIALFQPLSITAGLIQPFTHGEVENPRLRFADNPGGLFGLHCSLLI